MNIKKIIFFTTIALILVIPVYSFAYNLTGTKQPSSSVGYRIDSSASGYSSMIANGANMWTNNTHVNVWNATNLIGPLICENKVYAGWYGQTGWDGIATIYDNNGDGIIDKSTIQLNNTPISGPDYNADRVKLVVCHEFGHILGLDHVSSYTIMYGDGVWNSYLNNNSLLSQPASDDINGVNSLY